MYTSNGIATSAALLLLLLLLIKEPGPVAFVG